jgi:hypothetical protein
MTTECTAPKNDRCSSLRYSSNGCCLYLIWDQICLLRRSIRTSLSNDARCLLRAHSYLCCNKHILPLRVGIGRSLWALMFKSISTKRTFASSACVAIQPMATVLGKVSFRYEWLSGNFCVRFPCRTFAYKMVLTEFFLQKQRDMVKILLIWGKTHENFERRIGQRGR